MKRRALLHSAAAASLLGATPFLRAQGSLQRFKFNLGWKVEASGAGFVLAAQRGYYRQAGLDVAVDTGNGSAAAISLVATGAYDAASADLGTMIEFNTNNPANKLSAVAIQYDLNPNAVIVRKDGPIRSAADLAGRTIVGQPFNASRKMFPVLAKAQGFDGSGVKWENVAPDIGYTRFVKGDFDALAIFYFTGLLNLKSRGMGADQLRAFRYSELGVNSYGNGIVAAPKPMAESPEAMRAFVKASTQGWIEAIADPRAAASALKARDPLLDEAIELERLQLIIDTTMDTPAPRRDGWGAATTPRLQATIDETVAAFGLASRLAIADMWTDRFLPAPADRRLKA
ncbi:ABC transporter permease [Hydrogenophaga sp. PBC]|uniref:ABC transporter substrate-binding protein n=1 Tax=Hydrogenophaga sp. PBC TaxID=795665 RepID=UPI0008542519|nr:ABC transporter substrate-binding protein [Hydrogenophaga sp. PBC]AOS80209.1 ABC transporter permease [Hydrogenophaga sp. PBC]